MKFYPAQSFSVRQPFSSPFRHHALFGRTQCECRPGDWQTAYILLDSAGWVCSPERHQPHPKSLVPPSCNCPATHARLQECAAMRRSSRRRCPSPSVSQQVGRLRHTGHLCANSHSAESEEWRMVQRTPAGGAAARLGALWQTRRGRGQRFWCSVEEVKGRCWLTRHDAPEAARRRDGSGQNTRCGPQSTSMPREVRLCALPW